MRRRARRSLKPPGEGSGAHRCTRGELLNGLGFTQVTLHPCDGVGKEIRVVQLRERLVDVLRLSAIALGWNDQLPSQSRRHFAPIILSNDMEAEIDAGCTTSSGKDVTVIDEQDARIHQEIGIATSQFVALRPVGRGSPTVEQTRFGQDEGAGAEREHSAPSGVSPPELVEHAFGNCRGSVGRSHDHRFDPLQNLESIRDKDLEAAVRRQRGRILPTDEEPVPGFARSHPPIVAEDLTGHPELERRKSFVEDDGDVVRLAPGWPTPFR